MATGNYTISTDKTLLDIDTIQDFLSNRSYWGKGRSKELVRRSIENSICFGVYHGGGQVAFARVVSDLSVFAHMMDLFVLEAYRGQGIGKMLVDHIVHYPDFKDVVFIRLDTMDAHELYRQFGFTSYKYPDKAMERR